MKGEIAEDRVVFHLDLDCFYAQVEERRNPGLRGKPVAVQQQTITVTCNYLARSRGVRKLDSVSKALAVCPDLQLVPSVMQHYRDASCQVFDILRGFSRQIVVEKGGIDEAYLDITADVEERLPGWVPEKVVLDVEHGIRANVGRGGGVDVRGHGRGVHVANFRGFVVGDPQESAEPVDRLRLGAEIAFEIRQRIHSQLGFTTSGGIAQNKMLAKLAAGDHKPAAQTTLLPSGVWEYMADTPLRRIPGLGPKLMSALEPLDVTTGGDLQAVSLSQLQEHFDVSVAGWLYRACRGIDRKEVADKGPPKTIGVSSSGVSVANEASAAVFLRGQSEELLERIMADEAMHDRFPVSLILRYRLRGQRGGGYIVHSRAGPLPKGRPTLEAIHRTAVQLLQKHVKEPSALSLLGLSVSRFASTFSARSALARYVRAPQDSLSGVKLGDSAGETERVAEGNVRHDSDELERGVVLRGSDGDRENCGGVDATVAPASTPAEQFLPSGSVSIPPNHTRRGRPDQSDPAREERPGDPERRERPGDPERRHRGAAGPIGSSRRRIADPTRARHMRHVSAVSRTGVTNNELCAQGRIDSGANYELENRVRASHRSKGRILAADTQIGQCSEAVGEAEIPIADSHAATPMGFEIGRLSRLSDVGGGAARPISLREALLELQAAGTLPCVSPSLTGGAKRNRSAAMQLAGGEFRTGKKPKVGHDAVQSSDRMRSRSEMCGLPQKNAFEGPEKPVLRSVCCEKCGVQIPADPRSLQEHADHHFAHELDRNGSQERRSSLRSSSSQSSKSNPSPDKGRILLPLGKPPAGAALGAGRHRRGELKVASKVGPRSKPKHAPPSTRPAPRRETGQGQPRVTTATLRKREDLPSAGRGAPERTRSRPSTPRLPEALFVVELSARNSAGRRYFRCQRCGARVENTPRGRQLHSDRHLAFDVANCLVDPSELRQRSPSP